MIRLRDCRTMDRDGFTRHAETFANGRGPAGDDGTGLCMTAWQAGALAAATVERLGGRAVAVVPDFLQYARLLNTGQAGALAALAGGMGCAAAAGLKAMPAVLRSPLRTARQDFWVVAQALLRFDLALLPAAFRGSVLLHSYLADFAFAFDRRDLLGAHFSGARNPGIHTQQLPLALSCLARWGLAPHMVAFLCSPRDREGFAALASARTASLFSGTAWIGDQAGLPADLQDRAQHDGLAGIMTAADPEHFV